MCCRGFTERHYNMQNKMNHQNPWPSFEKPSLETILRSLSYQPQRPIATPESHWFKAAFDKHKQLEDQVKLMWLGHASIYLQLPIEGGLPVGVLFDPMFSTRCVTLVHGNQANVSLGAPLQAGLDQNGGCLPLVLWLIYQV